MEAEADGEAEMEFVQLTDGSPDDVLEIPEEAQSGVQLNLQLLQFHYDIVRSALDDLSDSV